MGKLYTKAKVLLATRDSGVTAAEYALILAFVALAIITAATALGISIANSFNEAAGELQS